MIDRPAVAYLSMEVALHPSIPTYAGGLGVLAGDTLRSAADLGLSVVGVSLLHRQGYFHQRIDAAGHQREEPVRWRAEESLEPLAPRVEVSIEGRRVLIRAWRFLVQGAEGAELPVYLLDTDLEENAPADRRITGSLYGGGRRDRLTQEIVLGIGGVRMLRALGHVHLDRFHLNEGHAALAILALLDEKEVTGECRDDEDRIEAVRRHCVFTTHTPVPAGHDRFPAELVVRMLGPAAARRLERLGQGVELNMTDLALRGSAFVNGVAMRHGEVSRGMFPGYPIRSITNGIHPPTWASPPFATLFDRQIPEWRRDPFALRCAVAVPVAEIRAAHEEAKAMLLERVTAACGPHFEPGVLTLGFARRATAYKRATLLFRDSERLAAIARAAGGIQVVFAGKAHPNDSEGKDLIRQIVETAAALHGRVAVAYLPNYDMELGRLLVAGCDVWLNTPVPPLEASGTSGMKAALNGVPSLSILDGWWVEGCVEGVTGWAVGEDVGAQTNHRGGDAADAEALYRKLEGAVLPLYYQQPQRFSELMRSCIALNASYFNTQRMLLQYLHDAYRDRHPALPTLPGR